MHINFNALQKELDPFMHDGAIEQAQDEMDKEVKKIRERDPLKHKKKGSFQNKCPAL